MLVFGLATYNGLIALALIPRGRPAASSLILPVRCVIYVVNERLPVLLL
jgi:hypothetical protein